MDDLLNLMNISSIISIIHSCVIHSHSYNTCVVRLYLLTSTLKAEEGGKKKKSRLYRTAWVTFCIIGVHILNIIITRLQMNSNFTSCQKESNEFLHEDFTESKSPDILLGVQPQLYTSSDVFSPPPSYTFASFRSFSQGFISSWHKKKKRERIPLLEILKIYV